MKNQISNKRVQVNIFINEVEAVKQLDLINYTNSTCLFALKYMLLCNSHFLHFAFS